ncbi:hypothetical protein GGD83_004004 [Rhodoblastus sphagnicola]|uniref:hypothetical protein n=1 Tax=Rhodoblastus sphagnicola TaxID=333368 RepID=UPI0011AFEC2C|nr:hypothetical protein [Rhodoblastus sphagnicola]MBB4200177.1 hypothetical protein [Rhodoblastus sphagnicola]
MVSILFAFVQAKKNLSPKQRRLLTAMWGRPKFQLATQNFRASGTETFRELFLCAFLQLFANSDVPNRQASFGCEEDRSTHRLARI